MKPFDRLVLIIILALIVLIAGIFLLGDRVGVQILAVYPSEGNPISINESIGITFDHDMDSESVLSGFSIEPPITGDLSWEDNTLWFSPIEPLDPAIEYQVSIASGVRAENNRELIEPFTFTVQIREPDLLFLVLDDLGGDIWRYEFGTGQTQPLTDTNSQVIDYTPDPIGSQIVFSQQNELGGSDLWVIDRDGQDVRILLDCEQDRCSQPDWSPNGEWIAYSREVYEPRENRYDLPRVWTIHVETTETAALYDFGDAYGHTPSFSPDGRLMATYDLNLHAIRILDLDTSEESVIPTTMAGVGDWSPDGQAMIFIDQVQAALEPNVGVYIVDFIEKDVYQAFGEFIPDIDFSQPRWSPDGEWVAVSLRPVGAGISKAIWLNSLDGREAYSLTDDPSATFSAYRWDPWGNRLVYQRFSLSGGGQHPQLYLWDRTTNTSVLLLETGARPEWLP